jgi:hypothetical protein
MFELRGSEGEHISLMCQCTGSQIWCAGHRRNDWVWAKQFPGRSYGALNQSLLWQLQRPFKINVQNLDGAFIEYRLALVFPTIPEKSGVLDPVLIFVQVRKALAAIAFHVFSVENIVSWAHGMPRLTTSHKTGH